MSRTLAGERPFTSSFLPGEVPGCSGPPPHHKQLCALPRPKGEEILGKSVRTEERRKCGSRYSPAIGWGPTCWLPRRTRKLLPTTRPDRGLAPGYGHTKARPGPLSASASSRCLERVGRLDVRHASALRLTLECDCAFARDFAGPFPHGPRGPDQHPRQGTRRYSLAVRTRAFGTIASNSLAAT